MLRVPTSDHLSGLTGKPRAKPAAAPAVAASAPAPATQPAALSPAIEHALLALAAQQRDATAAMLELARKPKQLQADVVRDDAGRMTRIIVTVTEGTTP
jgi:hypothetical protein